VRARGLPGALVAIACVAACSSSTTGAPGAGVDAGYCASNGYEAPVGSACPKGTCKTTGTAIACCGSLCPTCESKGLVSYDEAGACPANLCPSADVTASLACCDTCGPIGMEAGADVRVEAASE
jgi:hypothetical protein